MRWYNPIFTGLSRWIFRWVLGVEVRGLEHFPRNSGRPLVIVGNHLSLLDAPIVHAFMPERPVYPIDRATYEKKFIRFVLELVGTRMYPIDHANPLALRELIKYLRSKPTLHTCIFPEGRLSRTGKLMKVYDGAGMVADKLGAQILPVHFSGLELTPYTFIPRRWKTMWLPRVVMTIQPPVALNVPPDAKGRERRKIIGLRMYDILADSAYRASERDRTLFQELLVSVQKFGRTHEIANDIDKAPLTYGRLLVSSVVLGRALKTYSRTGETVGLMLPNAVGTLMSFFALHYAGRVPAMVNVSAGSASILAGCRAAGIQTVLTSRRFIEKGRLDTLVEELGRAVKVVYLDDVRAGLTVWDKLAGKVLAGRLQADYRPDPAAAGKPAVVLFTSGSEGAPKGVALSHRNLLSNRAQCASRMDFNPSDRVLNALPMFHSFGLGVGTLLPVLEGVPVFLYPSPLHFRMVPEMVYDEQATITFGTDTFLSRYARFAHPYDFNSVRYVFAGAEKLRDETRKVWMEKYGIRILEGYGATETSPVIAINTAMQQRTGTVGRLLPLLEHRIMPVPGIDQGGRLHVKGDNVMLGYLKGDKPGVIQPPLSDAGDGWYDTGDIVEVDAQGYAKIIGRAKRFAKIAGEMVSLAAAEELVLNRWPEHQHAVMSVPDARKGERLVLVSTRQDIELEQILEAAQRAGVPEIFVPRAMMTVEVLPLLGTGKPDYPAIQALVEARFGRD